MRRASAIGAAAFSAVAGLLTARLPQSRDNCSKRKMRALLNKATASLHNCFKKIDYLASKIFESVRILPQLVSYFSLADKSTLKVDESLALYENIRPWWLGSVPLGQKSHVKQTRPASFVIGYLNQDFEPSMALFEVSDNSKASGIFLSLRKQRPRTGEYRDINKALDPRLKRSLVKDASRKPNVSPACAHQGCSMMPSRFSKSWILSFTTDPMRSQFSRL